MKLKELRNQMKLTALELSKLAECKECQIYAYERGTYKPRPDIARRIAAIFSVSPSEIWPDMDFSGDAISEKPAIS